MKSRYAPRRQSFARIFIIFIAVILLAMGAGYVAAKHIIMPYLFGGKEADENMPGQISSPDIISGQLDVTEEKPLGSEGDMPKEINQNEAVTLYGIQYGSFNEKKRAEVALEELDSNKVEAYILPKNGAYKVIGSPYIDEQKAREALMKMKDVVGEDIFLVPMEVWIK